MKKITNGLIIFFMITSLTLTMACSVNEEENRMIDILNNRCTSCHDLDSTKNKSLPENSWREVIDDMISMGTNLDDEEKEALIKYLSEKYGV